MIQSGGGAALATGYFRAGLQPATSNAVSVTDPTNGTAQRHQYRARHRLSEYSGLSISTDSLRVLLASAP